MASSRMPRGPLNLDAVLVEKCPGMRWLERSYIFFYSLYAFAYSLHHSSLPSGLISVCSQMPLCNMVLLWCKDITFCSLFLLASGHQVAYNGRGKKIYIPIRRSLQSERERDKMGPHTEHEHAELKGM